MRLTTKMVILGDFKVASVKWLFIVPVATKVVLVGLLVLTYWSGLAEMGFITVVEVGK